MVRVRLRVPLQGLRGVGFRASIVYRVQGFCVGFLENRKGSLKSSITRTEGLGHTGV